ncbi:MAG: 30S ribosomal protein S6 [Ruminococcaceae bacterium]|nr:30S ribosomal protein S6 [Oscillospiraceae bacterium]
MVTNKYEVAMVFSVKNGDDAVNALNEKFSALIAENATVENVDDWGKRKLAYPINYETDGYYVFTTFVSAPEFPAELERIAGITDGVLRVMVIKK